jgi:hypothetical protein
LGMYLSREAVQAKEIYVGFQRYSSKFSKRFQ